MTTKTRTKHPKIDWRMSEAGEHFDSIAGVFDIDAAKRILIKKPRAIEQLTIAQVRDLVHPRTGIHAFRVPIDWERIDTDATIDLSVPVIIADLGPTCFPIDGWHRIAKAVDQGLESIPCVVLTTRETKAVKL